MSQEGLGPPIPQTHKELLASFGISHNDNKFFDSFRIVAGRGNPILAAKIGVLVGSEVVDNNCESFSDGEIKTQIKRNVRLRDVFVINSHSPDPNTRVVETIILADAARRAHAKGIHLIAPYFAYSRQDRKTGSRQPISAAAIANAFVNAGVNDITTIDIHNPAITGSISVPWDDTVASKIFLKELLGFSNSLRPGTPDMGGGRRASKYQEKLQADGVVFVYKNRDVDKTDTSNTVAMLGDVEDRDVVLIDDEISTGGTIFNAADLLKRKGAKRVYAVATHAKFAKDSRGRTVPKRMQESNNPIDMLFITDTIDQSRKITGNDNIRVLSVAPVFASAILCNLTGESLSERLGF